MQTLGDPELARFVDEHVVSFAHWDLLAILSHQSNLPADPSTLAKLTGRSEEEVMGAVHHLEKSGLLEAEAGASGGVFKVDVRQRELLDKFVSAIEDREKRLYILTKVLANRSTF